MNSTRKCAACGIPFLPRPQVLQQRYCPAADCQRERRRRWQQQHLRSDADYRDNQARATAAWLKRHRDYWSRYRDTHTAYTNRNRELQRARNHRRRSIAKMDLSGSQSPLPSGIYTLKRKSRSGIAKMDVWTVQIVVLPPARAPAFVDCKEMT